MNNHNSGNITKNNISKKISSKIGFSKLYSDELTNDLIEIFKILIKKEGLLIKNFGVFKTTYKKERLGRNPKTKKIYKINERISLSFSVSKKLNNKINYP